jgi:hypothetical protein
MVGMMHFLAEGAAFALGTILQPGRFPPDLEPEALSKSFGPRVSGIMHAMAAEAIARGMVPLLSFADFAGRTYAPDGRFEPPLTRTLETFASSAPFFSYTFGHLAKTFIATSAFLFFRTSGEMGTERGP